MKKKLLYRRQYMTLLGGLSGATLLSYIYVPSLPFKNFKNFKFFISLFSNSIYIPAHWHCTWNDLGVLSKQLNYQPGYSSCEIEKWEMAKQHKAHLTHEQMWAWTKISKKEQTSVNGKWYYHLFSLMMSARMHLARFFFIIF
jgi:hypothetical protein